MLSYCTTSVEASGSYFLRLASLPTGTRLFIIFWDGNSLHSMCLATFPGHMCIPSELIPTISSFGALLEKDAQLLFVSGFTQRFMWTVSRVLPQHKSVCQVTNFDEDDLEQTFLVPTIKIRGRFDIPSVLDFLMVRLQLACSKLCLTAFPDF